MNACKLANLKFQALLKFERKMKSQFQWQTFKGDIILKGFENFVIEMTHLNFILSQIETPCMFNNHTEPTLISIRVRRDKYLRRTPLCFVFLSRFAFIM